MNDSIDEAFNPGTEEVSLVGRLLRTCAIWLLADPDPQRFMARMAEQAPVLFPGVVYGSEGITLKGGAMRRVGSRVDPEVARFFRAFGWMVAGLMPLPSQGFKPMKLARPGRNEACVCGSLKKFKHCCGPLFEHMPTMEPLVLAGLVINELPRKQWATLPVSGVTPDMVLAAVDLMREAGRADDALRVLEPWAKQPQPWPDAVADLLDALGDVYLDLVKPRKRKQLAQAMSDPRNGIQVQSMGWQRLSMMASDAGLPLDAQAAFERAQRLTPDEPRIAVLEITTLWANGDIEHAQARADFHAKRLARLPHAAALADEIEVLTTLARGEFEALGMVADEDDDPLDLLLDPDGQLSVLTEWAQGLATPSLRLDLSGATTQDLGALRPRKQDRALLKRWAATFGLPAPERANERWPDDTTMRVFDTDLWSPLLMREPHLIDHFEVLDHVLMALDVVPTGLADTLIALLELRASFLWDQLRERYPNARCEWAHLENRPALRLLVRRVEADTTPTARHAYEALRALVDVLNPHDNHGLRERLAAVYLRRGEVDAALALCERYPGDFVGMQLLHVRALLRAGRVADAVAQLAEARLANVHALDLLRAKGAPRVPDVDHYAIGSLEQAKIAIAPQFDLWHGDPAVTAWLARQASGAQSEPPTPSLFGPDE